MSFIDEHQIVTAKDSGLKKFSNPLKKADEIIKNTYRTLLSRGKKGCFVYCEDKAFGNYIKSIFKPK